jgi:hypothetical protein
VEIAVPVTDLGVGVASLSLALDVAGPPAAVSGAQAADGTWHFNLPASVVRGREGQLRFSLTATDKLQHTSTIPAGDSTAIWVDDKPPTVTLAKVDYANASPALSVVCGLGTVCGRGATRLLRDDTVKFWFDAYDCGVGMGPQVQQSATVKSGGQTNPATFSTTGTIAGPCVSGNPTHRYTFTLNLATMAPALDPPDANGTAVVQLISTAVDTFAHASQSAPALGATTGDGLALISLWRWKVNLPSDATGSPALLRGNAGSRDVAIGTGATTTAANLFVLHPDGSQAWSAKVTAGIAGDVAVGPEAGLLYVVSPDTGSTLSIIPAPPAPVLACPATSVKFGKSPAITNLLPASPSNEVAVVVDSGHNIAGNYLFVFKNQSPSCLLSQNLISSVTDFTGVSAIPGTVFLSNPQGFISIDQSGNGFSNNQMSYSPSPVSALAPPSISTPPSAPVNAIFGGGTLVRRTSKATCGVLSTPCWTTDGAFVDPNAGRSNSALPFTPVFDGTTIWSADDLGTVYTWDQTTGKPLKSKNTGPAVSSPVLLQDGSALIVLRDGTVETLSPGMVALPLVKVGPFGPSVTPVTPAIDVRAGGGGVAYVPAPQGWVYALQIPQAPMPAGSTVWPRPGHDSCNSRNANTSNTICP